MFHIKQVGTALQTTRTSSLTLMEPTFPAIL